MTFTPIFKTPHEYYLEHQVETLKRKIELLEHQISYLDRRGAFDYTTFKDPAVVPVLSRQNNITLSSAASVYLNDDPSTYSFHVVGEWLMGDGIGFNYYIDKGVNLKGSSKIAILDMLHQRVLQQFLKYLDAPKP